MTLAFAFWVIMLLTIVFAAWVGWPRTPETRWSLGGSVLWWILLALLGWATFGPPLRA